MGSRLSEAEDDEVFGKFSYTEIVFVRPATPRDSSLGAQFAERGKLKLATTEFDTVDWLVSP